jgi:hypothetical protein
MRTIDMKFANGRMVLGIYDLSGDVLTICVAEAGHHRPAGMIPRGSQWVERWKRVVP